MSKNAKTAPVTVAAPALPASMPEAAAPFRNFVAIGFAYGMARANAVDTFHAIEGDTNREYARDCFKVGYIISRVYEVLDADSETQGWRIFSAAPWAADNAPAAKGRQRRTQAEQNAYKRANEAWSTISRAEASIGRVSTRGRKAKTAEEKAAEAAANGTPVAALEIGALATPKDAVKAASTFRDEWMAFATAVRKQVPNVSAEADKIANDIYGLINRYSILVGGK